MYKIKEAVSQKMEEVSNRFPSLVPMILENVNNESLVKFKETSREMSEFLINDRFYWIRILKKYDQNFEEFSKAWKMVIEKTPVTIVQKLALAAQKFFRDWNDPWEKYRSTDYEPRQKRQWSPLHIAAETRDYVLLKHVVEKIEDEYQEHSSSGNDITALHLAAEKGSLIACQFIINHSLYKGGKDKYGRTPIDTAAIHCKWEVCRFLLENSDDFPIDNFKIPLLIAPYRNQTEIFKLFFEHARNKNLPLNPQNSDDDLQTPLHRAAQMGNLEICKLIVGEVKNISQGCFLGYTPLHAAAGSRNRNQMEIFKLIFDRVQDKEPEDTDGRTPLHHAARCGSLEVSKLLIEELDNKNPRDSKGWTPLHCAAQNGHEEICDLIASRVLDKNPRACDGTTPEFLMRRFRQFSDDFQSLSPVLSRRKPFLWWEKPFEKIGDKPIWWAK